MDALTLIVSLALAAGVFGLVLYPLWQQTRPEAVFQADRSGQTLEEYEARYQAALEAIKDLMFDREMSKISSEDYERLLTKIKLEAAEIRHQMDRFSHSAAAGVAAALDVEIERLVAQLRKDQPVDEHAMLQQEVEAEIEVLKNIRLNSAEVGESACLHCGQAFLPGDVFCTGCGQSLPEIAVEEADLKAETCPACGYAYQAGDAFCAKCGQVLSNGGQAQATQEVVTG